MNSYVKRQIQRILPNSSAMLWHAGASESMWALVAKALVYLNNRVPNKSLPDKPTPYGMCKGQKQYKGHVRI